MRTSDELTNDRIREIKRNFELKLLSELQKIRDTPGDEWSPEAVAAARQLVDERESTGSARSIDQEILKSRELAKTIEHLDAENDLIGPPYQHSSNNHRMVVPYRDDKFFRLDPAPMPMASILGMNVLLVSVFSAVYVLTINTQPGSWVNGGVVAIGLLTCAIYSLLVYYTHIAAIRLGPCLIYDRKTRSVALPREKLVFDMDDVIHIQSVSGHLRDEIESMWMAELNLVAIKDGQRRRWNLDVSSSMIRPFGKLPAIIEQETGIPVVRIGSRL